MTATGFVGQVKRAVQGTLKTHPWMRRNRIYYEIQRRRQYRPCRVDPSLAERPDIVEALVRDGCYVLPDFLSRETCEAIIRELDPPLREMLEGSYSGKFQIHPFLEAYRLGEVDRLSPSAAKAFFGSSFIESIAHAYVGPTAISYRREADFKLAEVHTGSFLQSELPHFDDWRHRFKAFLYLTDVGAENAPFVFYSGTHTYADWNRRYYREYEIDGESGRYGHFFPQEMRRLMAAHGFREIEFTAAAGTLIFADTRGIHRGTTLRRGRRILLNSTYGITLDGF